MDLNRYLDFRHRYQLVLDLIIWLFWTCFLLFIGEFIRVQFSKNLPYITNSPETIRIAIFFLLLISLVHLTKDSFLLVHIYFSRDKTYILNNKDWPSKWMFNGKTELKDNSYLMIKSSRAGCLLKNHYWKDFRMSFEMRFLNKDEVVDDYQKRVGLIFRASDLDNYFMLEIGKAVENGIDSSIKPHVRFKGGWDIPHAEKSTETFDFSSFEKVTLEVKDNLVELLYKNTPVFSWILPTHVDVNHIESGVRDEDRSNSDKNITIKAFSGHVQDIPFRLGYGLVGFRAYMKHGAMIRGLKVEPL